MCDFEFLGDFWLTLKSNYEQPKLNFYEKFHLSVHIGCLRSIIPFFVAHNAV